MISQTIQASRTAQLTTVQSIRVNSRYLCAKRAFDIAFTLLDDTHRSTPPPAYEAVLYNERDWQRLSGCSG